MNCLTPSGICTSVSGLYLFFLDEYSFGCFDDDISFFIIGTIVTNLHMCLWTSNQVFEFLSKWGIVLTISFTAVPVIKELPKILICCEND